jgi:hypothetical protein
MRRSLLTVGLVAVVALTAGACAGGTSAASGTTTTIDPEEAMLEFARCMREHGVDMPDPGTQGRGRITFGARAGDEEQVEEFEEAQEACRQYLQAAGPGSLDAEDRQKLQDAMVAFARCMRGKGFDVPDPDVSGGGGIIMRARPGQRADVDEPGFAEAERQCRRTTLEPVEKDLGIEGPRRSTR